MDETVALIPARGGSKGLPRKNLAGLCGKPLIAWTIEAALKSTAMTRVFVTTDDDEIGRVATSYGAEVIRRPAELATDEARSDDVVRHALQALEDLQLTPRYLALLQPTSPLRTEDHIDALIRSALEAGTSCAWSVTSVDHHPWKMLVERDGEVQPVARIEDLSAPRQELPRAYRQNGAIYWVSNEAFQRHKGFFAPPVHLYEMSAVHSVDIDTAADLEAARRLLESR